MIKVLDTAKLPLAICKGSVKERTQLADKMLRKYYETISPKIDTKLKLYEIKTAIINALPPQAHIRLKVIKSTLGDNYHRPNTDQFERANRHIIGLIKDNRTDKYPKDILLHEPSHFFYAICHPKILCRMKDIPAEKYEDLYMMYYNYIYTPQKIKPKKINYEINKLLQSFNDNEKVNALQDIRYNLQSEIKAWQNETIGCELDKDYYKFRFEKKLELLNAKLKEVIQEIRTRHANKLHR